MISLIMLNALVARRALWRQRKIQMGIAAIVVLALPLSALFISLSSMEDCMTDRALGPEHRTRASAGVVQVFESGIFWTRSMKAVLSSDRPPRETQLKSECQEWVHAFRCLCRGRNSSIGQMRLEPFGSLVQRGSAQYATKAKAKWRVGAYPGKTIGGFCKRSSASVCFCAAFQDEPERRNDQTCSATIRSPGVLPQLRMLPNANRRWRTAVRSPNIAARFLRCRNLVSRFMFSTSVSSRRGCWKSNRR